MLRMPNQNITTDEADTFVENLKKEPQPEKEPGSKTYGVA